MIIPQLAAGVAILMTVYATLSCEFVQTEQRFLGFQYPNSKSKFGIGLYSRESPIDNDNSCVWFDGDDFGTLFDTAFFMAVGANTLSGAAGFLTYFFSLFMWFCPCCAMRWSIAIQTAFYFMCFLSTCFSQSIYWSEVCNENKCNVDPDGSEGSLCFQSHCSIGKGSAVAFCAAPFWLLASILTFRLRPHCLPSPPEKKRDKESGILWFGSRTRLPWGGRRQVQRDGDYDPALSTSDHLYVGLEEFIRDLDHSLDDISIDDLSILIDDNGNISCSELDRDKKKHAAAASTSGTRVTIQTEDESAALTKKIDSPIHPCISDEKEDLRPIDIELGQQVAVSPLKGSKGFEDQDVAAMTEGRDKRSVDSGKIVAQGSDESNEMSLEPTNLVPSVYLPHASADASESCRASTLKRKNSDELNYLSLEPAKINNSFKMNALSNGIIGSDSSESGTVSNITKTQKGDELNSSSFESTNADNSVHINPPPIERNSSDSSDNYATTSLMDQFLHDEDDEENQEVESERFLDNKPTQTSQHDKPFTQGRNDAEKQPLSVAIGTDVGTENDESSVRPLFMNVLIHASSQHENKRRGKRDSRITKENRLLRNRSR